MHTGVEEAELYQALKKTKALQKLFQRSNNELTNRKTFSEPPNIEFTRKDRNSAPPMEQYFSITLSILNFCHQQTKFSFKKQSIFKLGFSGSTRFTANLALFAKFLFIDIFGYLKFVYFG